MNMTNFKRKTFYAAVLAAISALGAADSAHALQLGMKGTGSVLLYPYYTVRTTGNGPYNTYLNVTNTTSSAKVVKVRFREGKNGRSVLDFNLWLSPNDMWAGAVSATATGATLASADESCVSAYGGVSRSITAGMSFDFTNANYGAGAATTDNSTGVDGADTSLDRTREGYMEIIEMGVVTDAALKTAVTHNSAGRPNNCALIPMIDTLSDGTAGGRLAAGTGGLIGGASLINVTMGSDYGYDPVVLEDFQTVAPIFTAPGILQPDLNSATPVSRAFYYHQNAAGAFVTDTVQAQFSGATAGADAVSSVLEHTSVMNTYVLDTATLSATDWVLTFPTKHHYIQPASITPLVDDNIRPFGTNYSEFGATGSCGKVSWTAFDREEQYPPIITIEILLPPNPPPTALCWESTVVNFYPATSAAPTPANSSLGSTNRSFPGVRYGLGWVLGVPYDHGWAKLEFGTWDNTGLFFTKAYTNLPSTDATPVVFHGLPVIGFMTQDFLNTNVIIGGLPSASSYGGNFNHKYTDYITGGNPALSNAPSQY